MSASRQHIVIDARGQALGRLASTVASLLRGKHQSDFSPNRLSGIHVTVRNLRSLSLPVYKLSKPVRHFSGYPGGLKETTFEKSFKQNADRAFRRVVRRMLPDNHLRRPLLRFLHTID